VSTANWIVRQMQSIFGQSCFAAGTLVQTEHGLRAIETIRPGDMVLSRDDATGRTGYRRVSAVKSPTTDDLYTVDLDVSDAGKGMHHADFEATATHPWRTAHGHWVQTADLRPGTHLVRADGAAGTVDFVRDTHHAAPTYNLTVEGWHTYFIGKDKVWVHDACKPRLPGQSGKEAADNIPSWAQGEAPQTTENGRAFATRLLARLIHDAGKNERIILFLQRLMCRFAVAKNATGQFAETLADDGLCSEWLNLVNNPV